VLFDPYFFVFWTGKILSFLVYRGDGILVYNYDLEKTKSIDRLLLSSFLTAVSGFGSEIILGKTKLKSLEFYDFSVYIVSYEDLYMAIVGKDISPKINSFAKRFLMEIWNLEEVHRDIMGLEKDEFERIDNLFNELVAKVVL